LAKRRWSSSATVPTNGQVPLTFEPASPTTDQAGSRDPSTRLQHVIPRTALSPDGKGSGASQKSLIRWMTALFVTLTAVLVVGGVSLMVPRQGAPARTEGSGAAASTGADPNSLVQSATSPSPPEHAVPALGSAIERPPVPSSGRRQPLANRRRARRRPTVGPSGSEAEVDPAGSEATVRPARLEEQPRLPSVSTSVQPTAVVPATDEADFGY
jgi:hypothetical protein